MRTVIRKKLEHHVENLKERRQREKEVAHLLRRFGRYLRKRREEENCTFRQFAQRAQMAHSNIYVIEQSKKDPHLSELLKLSQACGQTLREFLEPLLQDEETLNALAGATPREKFSDVVIGERQVNE